MSDETKNLVLQVNKRHLLCSEDSDKTLECTHLSKSVATGTGMLNYTGNDRVNRVVPQLSSPQQKASLILSVKLRDCCLWHPTEHEIIQHLWMKYVYAHSSMSLSLPTAFRELYLFSARPGILRLLWGWESPADVPKEKPALFRWYCSGIQKKDRRTFKWKVCICGYNISWMKVKFEESKISARMQWIDLKWQ